MVLGLRSKGKRGGSFAIEFYIQVQEIKPWPKSQNRKAPTPVVLQWSRGDKRTGNTRAVVPDDSLDEGRVAFHESFRLPATLYKEESKNAKNPGSGQFQKKCVIFSLFETSVKGDKIGTAVLDLAGFGNANAVVATSIPLALSKKVQTSSSPSLFLSIGPYGKKSIVGRSASLSGHDKSRAGTSSESAPDPSLDAESREALVAALMSDQEDEIAAFTDDEDESPSSSSRSLEAKADEMKISHSSTSSPSTNSKNASQSFDSSPALSRKARRNSSNSLSEDQLQLAQSTVENVDKECKSQMPSSATASAMAAASAYAAKRGMVKEASSSRDSSVDMSSEAFSPDSDGSSTPISAGSRSPNVTKSPVGRNQLLPTPSPLKPPLGSSLTTTLRSSTAAVSEASFSDADKAPKVTMDGRDKVTEPKSKASNLKEWQDGEPLDERRSNERKSGEKPDGPRGQPAKTVDTRKIDESGGKGEFRVLQEARSRLAKGLDGDKITEKFENRALEEAIKTLEIAEGRIRSLEADCSKLSKHLDRCNGELTDIAAAEISLYSVVPEHGGSSHKVHAPARRLARLYLHACKNWSPERRAGSARNSVAGIVLVVRGCGHDVSRLTFWWSNVLVLRETISQACSSSRPNSSSEGVGDLNMRQSQSIDLSTSVSGNGSSKLTGSSRQTPSKENSRRLSLKGSSDWKEVDTYIGALERVEAWIHGRVIECVWWQAIAPHMQRLSDLSPLSSPRPNSPDVRLIGRSSTFKAPSDFGDGRQGNTSVDIWKKALLDVHERLCPVRAAGHDCGCLHSLIILVMEQCAARLDVAMFNALLRDANEFVPSDPVSDPIGDPNVLPVPPGKLTFGDGAQLKNTVATWSNWLAGLLGTGDESVSGEVYNHDHDVGSVDEVDKGSLYFKLLRATADLLMLPKDILMDKSVRKEVCPALSLPLIKRILSIFEPDEFFPDPVSPGLLAALNAEVAVERRKHGESDNGPLSVAMASAPPCSYVPPPSALVQEIIGEANPTNKLSRTATILRKGYTSDDELEELESPASLMLDPMPGMEKPAQDSSALIRQMSIFGKFRKDSSVKNEEDSGVIKRFKFLREVWLHDE